MAVSGFQTKRPTRWHKRVVLTPIIAMLWLSVNSNNSNLVVTLCTCNQATISNNNNLNNSHLFRSTSRWWEVESHSSQTCRSNNSLNNSSRQDI